ncbi:MAG TPA: hypothetical protein VF403_05470 [Kofleriaceae bacterium]
MLQWSLVLFSVAACGRVDFGELTLGGTDASPSDANVAPRPIHQYSLNNSYADDFGGPSLVGHGGGFFTGGYQFGPNQGLTVDDALPQDIYTVDIEFSFADLAGWRKILDYQGLTLDNGFYTYESALQYVIVPEADFLTTPEMFTVDTQVRVTLTRDASTHVVGYIATAPVGAVRAADPAPPTGALGTAFEFDDPTRVAALTGTTTTFFIDDASTSGGESTSGTVRRIQIYDVALTAAQVAAAP